MQDDLEQVPLTPQDMADLEEAEAVARRDPNDPSGRGPMAYMAVAYRILEEHGFDPFEGSSNGRDRDGSPTLWGRPKRVLA